MLLNTPPSFLSPGSGMSSQLLSGVVEQGSGVSIMGPQEIRVLPKDSASSSACSKHFVERVFEERFEALGGRREGSSLGVLPAVCCLVLAWHLETHGRVPSCFFSSLGSVFLRAWAPCSFLTSTPKASDASSPPHSHRADSVFFLSRGAPTWFTEEPLEGPSSRLSASTGCSLWLSLQRGRPT